MKKRREKRKYLIFAIVLVIIIFAINYSFLDRLLTNSFKGNDAFEKDVFVERVIDGDTIETALGHIRLLGINSPEKGEAGYEEAKDYLIERVLNQSVKLEYGKERNDKYGRILAYVFLNNENINLELVEKGYANYYFPSGKDKYYSAFEAAWDKCIADNINLCEKSSDYCEECILVKRFDYLEGAVTLRNICNVDCNLNGWSIKKEGRKKLILNFTLESLDDKEISFDDVWTSTGDTLFLRDSEDNLVSWKSY